MLIYYIMPCIFILGILGIALEDKIRVNKAATALATCIALWTAIFFANTRLFEAHPSAAIQKIINGIPKFAELTFQEQVARFMEFALSHHLGDVATTLFFVMASMVIINLVDRHGGFAVISRRIVTRRPRPLLWIFAGLTFVLSALLGNLATVIIIIAILQKIITNRDTRLIYSCIMVFAANAGGAWSPIGDVTTLLLWSGNNITAEHQILHVLPASIVMCLVPLLGATFMLPAGGEIGDAAAVDADGGQTRQSSIVLAIGLTALAIVPVLKSLLDLPPFMTVLLGLAVLWIYTDRCYHGREDDSAEYRVDRTLARIDMSTVLFFLGILLSVAALNTAGQLAELSKLLSTQFSDPSAISFVLGICSSFLDNVALVAAAQGMYPVAVSGAFATNSIFWTLLAYCAVTGGSILIIGSAAGVTVMGLEKIGFMYYLKRFSLLGFIGYCAGAGVFFLF